MGGPSLVLLGLQMSLTLVPFTLHISADFSSAQLFHICKDISH